MSREGLPSVPGSEWLVGGGEMGTVVRSMDWAATPLGPMGQWPTGLRTTISLSLSSSFPISVAWGPQHTQIYNDGYWPICGDKHPVAMGMDFSVCWASAFPVIGETFHRAVEGTTGYLENQRMFLDRLGYLEETFFTFSFSPIRDSSGAVAGLFHPVTETTPSMLSQRRARVLRDLAAGALNPSSMLEALRSAAGILAGSCVDIPFVLIYQVNDDGRSADLVAHHGLAPGGSASPLTVSFDGTDPVWPLTQVLASREPVLVSDLAQRFPGLICEPYPEPIASAFVLPITPAGYGGPPCLMVAGTSPRLPMNESYQAFYALVAGAVTTVIVNATAISAARQRAEALAEINQAKTAFFNNVSHEFRTPLTLMLGPIEDEISDLDAAPLDETSAVRRERLETAHRNSLRLLRLTNTLLDFARIEEGRASACFEATDLSAMTADLAGTFRSACERAGLRLEVTCLPLPDPVYVDHDMWEGVVLNLLSNALKFTASGRIAVQVQLVPGEGDQADQAELTVRDTGAGIPAEELPRIFERFYRVPGVQGRSHEGSGIGLAFARQLVEQHGGMVGAASEPGTGTVITVRLPLGSSHLPAEQVRAAGQELRAAGGSMLRSSASLVQEAMRWLPSAPDDAQADPFTLAGPEDAVLLADDMDGRPRILWVDDNADMRAYVTRLLSARYEVETAADGQEALEATARRMPDLVLTDVMMPRLDGFGLLHALREAPATRAIPVILLSARAGEETVLEGLASGADDYLVKPFTARELSARIGSHLQLASLRRQAEAARVTLELNAGLEQRIRERTAELASTNVQLTRANRELEAFSYSVSHDLRAPLRAIDGFTRLLLDQHVQDLPEQGQRYVATVRGSAQRMGRLIDGLLAFSRLGRQEVVKRDVNMRALVLSCWEDLAMDRTGRRIDLTVGDLPGCRADSGLLRQVWTNLLDNAMKYTGGRSVARIEVLAEQFGDEVVYVCRDNGAGFDMRYAGKLFSVFQRLHRDEDFEGTGVGLAIAEQIVHRHSGRIWAEAEVDAGATFRFTVGPALIPVPPEPALTLP